MAEETDKPAVTLTVPKEMLTSSKTQIRAKADGFQQIYTNNIQIGFSTFDLGLTFGQIVGEQEGKTIIEENVRVLLSRELAKILAGLLLSNIQAYEQQFGEIKIPTLLLADEEEAEPEGEEENAPEQLMTQAVKRSKRR